MHIKDYAPFLRNPLGIIGLFIVFIYGIASYTFNTIIEHVGIVLKSSLVWFIILFPCIILWVFYWLVTRHHHKLYAPKDFENPDHFMDTISRATPDEVNQKLQEEVSSQFSSTKEPLHCDKEETSVEELYKTLNHSQITKLFHLSRREHMENAREAEYLALKALSEQYKYEFEQNIKIGDIIVDGFSDGGEVKTVVEIKYVTSQYFSNSSSIERMKRQFNDLSKRFPNTNTEFLLVIVKASEIDEKKLIERLSYFMDKSGLKVKIVFFDFVELKAKYGCESGGE